MIAHRVRIMVKGCKFHWAQSVKRVATATTKDLGEREEIKRRLIPLFDGEHLHKFEVEMEWFLEQHPTSQTWVDWWTRLDIAKMAFRCHTDNTNWDTLPSTNNIAESAHANIVRDNTNKSYSSVVQNMWKNDFSSFLILMASQQGVLQRWSGISDEARERNNEKRRKKRAEERTRDATGRPMDLAYELDAAYTQQQKKKKKRRSKPKRAKRGRSASSAILAQLARIEGEDNTGGEDDTEAEDNAECGDDEDGFGELSTIVDDLFMVDNLEEEEVQGE